MSESSKTIVHSRASIDTSKAALASVPSLSVWAKLGDIIPKLVLAPSFLLSMIFVYGFLIWTAVLSMTKSRMLPVYDFNGIEAYLRLFNNERWLLALKNLGVFGGLFIGFSLAVGLLLAILLDQKIRGEGFLRGVFLYPVEIYSNDPLRAEPMLNDASILSTNLRQPLKAKSLLEHITQNLKESTSPHTMAMAHANLGTILSNLKRYKEAETQFLSAVILSENRYEMLEFITKYHRKQKAFSRLTKLIKRLNSNIPGSGILYALLGETLSEDLSKHDQALEAFSDAIILEPKRSDFYNGMGLTYYRQKSFQKALRTFHQASKIDPDDAIARYNIACVLSRLDREKEALLALKEAISLDPRLIENARTDSDFANLHSTPSFTEILENRKEEKLSH